MSMKFLGEQIDIHGGGQDVVFPHHENEIAQSESFTGKKPFVKYWMHNGLMQMGAEKMSKSLGNLITIREALKKYSADGIRVFVLSSYYRSPLTYTAEAMDAAQAGAERLARVANKEIRAGKGKTLDEAPYRQRFIDAMDDDFNTPQALAALFDLARDVNRAEEEGMSVTKGRETLTELGGVLGLTFKEREEPTINAIEYHGETVTIQEILEERSRLRQAKKWKEADDIRDKLASQGVIIEDLPDGTATFRIKRR
jgi:cysteinyl-tRNA synthetase